ncbi:hypothetical protein [Moorena sp. SIO3H5]|uniref:hypothetical protein n=1 Tax=Moorena sp. SIO3H5 TaxID=2607834 RepID=UPI0013B6B423|nr:hypothetical protein [Moorena sp. SIO3H5]NEO70937.1 hypothetical protein [Moorena sp. SIO3H5]
MLLFPVPCSLFPVPCSLFPVPVLMQSLMGETTPVRSWGEPPRPHWLPKTALHRCSLFPKIQKLCN